MGCLKKRSAWCSWELTWSPCPQAMIFLLRDSDFIIFPTRRYTSGIGCAEANASSLASIVADPGEAVTRCVDNGMPLPGGGPGAEYSDAVKTPMAVPARYLEVPRASPAA